MKALERAARGDGRRALVFAILTTGSALVGALELRAQSAVTMELGRESLTFDPFGNDARLEVLVSNAAKRTVVVRAIHLNVLNYRPYILYTFPSQPLAPPRRVRLTVTLARDTTRYELYHIAKSRELISVTQGTTTAVDVAVRALHKGAYAVTLSGDWYYFDEPKLLHEFQSGTHELRFPSVETWESVAHGAGAVFAYLTNPQSLTHFLLNMGFARPDAVSRQFGFDALTIERDAIVYMAKAGNRYLPSFLRNATLNDLARTRLTVGLGCGIDLGSLEFYRARFLMESSAVPWIETRYVECNSESWRGVPQILLNSSEGTERLLVHDVGMSWARQAQDADAMRYAALLR